MVRKKQAYVFLRIRLQKAKQGGVLGFDVLLLHQETLAYGRHPRATTTFFWGKKRPLFSCLAFWRAGSRGALLRSVVCPSRAWVLINGVVACWRLRHCLRGGEQLLSRHY